MAKFYGVRIGNKPGVYETWAECQTQTKGFKGAIFKSFGSREEAEEFIGVNLSNETAKQIEEPGASLMSTLNENSISIYTDGSFNKNKPNHCGYGIGIFKGKNLIEVVNGYVEEEDNSWNVTGEICGVTNAIKIALGLGFKEITVFYDYQGVEYWATGSWKRDKEISKNYHEFIQSIKNSIKINFCHTEAHTSIEGNELADKLAKLSIDNIKPTEMTYLTKTLSKLVNSDTAIDICKLKERLTFKDNLITVMTQDLEDFKSKGYASKEAEYREYLILKAKFEK